MDVLIVVDVQNDFCEGGSLAVPHGSEIVPIINAIRYKFQKVYISLDWHPADHVSFYTSHPESSPFTSLTYAKTGLTVDQWPPHCVQDTEGAKVHKDLVVLPEDVFIVKGVDSDYDAYSAFGSQYSKSTLEEKLRQERIRRVYCCGLAYDYCVGSTAIDSAMLGYETYVITDCCKSIADDSECKMTERLKDNGVKLVTSQEI